MFSQPLSWHLNPRICFWRNLEILRYIFWSNLGIQAECIGVIPNQPAQIVMKKLYDSALKKIDYIFESIF